MKKVKAQADAQIKKSNETSKVINAAIKNPAERPTMRVFIQEDVLRVHTHKEMMMDFLFTEMEEHSKKLQMYAEFYDYFQRGINVEKEFLSIM